MDLKGKISRTLPPLSFQPRQVVEFGIPDPVLLPDNPPPFLADLPNDILYYILTTIPPADAAALALSCKFLWALLGGSRRFKPLLKEDKDRVSLLRRLEVYYPKHILCYRCVKFHPRQKPLFWRPRSWRPKLRQCNRVIGDDKLLCIPFEKAKEVMNHHRYGEKYGHPANILDFNVSNSPYSGTRVTAKIVSGQLIIMYDTPSWLPHDDMKRVAHEHFGCSSQKDGRSCCNYPDDYMQTEKNIMMWGRCTCCASEYRLTINAMHSKEFGEFGMTRWRNLGACDDPFSDEWRCAVDKGWHSCRCNFDIRPEDSLYSTHFDDTSPFHEKVKHPKLLVIPPTYCLAMVRIRISTYVMYSVHTAQSGHKMTTVFHLSKASNFKGYKSEQ
ncbi:hypothetical protein AJ80_02445 [Polytolypa hystricis UAMH7299]|uniref:F-box domain-containing protein n=1 Tax=Polytolypa hystricis (strain UAMH7299) TaxID=1447883 RepID=A0A2B7YR04_POLH7|nr:hypothetical protein AJ80_02445 [Polytolypa hystricis UAMH7299]